MASINIVGTKGDKSDPAFRYKMPRMVVKIEGSGNGIKTGTFRSIFDVFRNADRFFQK